MVDLEAHLQSARAAFEKKDYGLCRSELEKARLVEPEHRDVQRWLARVGYRLAEWKVVLESSSLYLRTNPDDREMVQLRARACNYLRLWEEASEGWQHLTLLRPEWPECWYQLAKALMKSDRPVEALTAAGKLRELGVPAALALAARFFVEIGQTTSARDCYAAFGRSENVDLNDELTGYEKRNGLRGIAAVLAARRALDCPEDLKRVAKVSEDLIRRAIAAERAEEFGEAYLDYVAATVLKPDDVLAMRSMSRVLQKLYALAIQHAERGEFIKAVRLYQDIMCCSEDSYKAALALARLFMQLQQWGAAAETWQTVRTLMPDSRELRIQQARAIERAEQFAQTADAWRAVKELDPLNEEAETALNRLPARMIKAGRLAAGDRRYRDAWRILSAVPLQSPERADADRRLAQIGRYLRKEMRAAYKERRYLAIVENGETAMELLPRDADILRLIAKSAGRISAYTLARTAWRKFIDLEPASEISNYLELAKCYLELSEFEEGQAVLRIVLERDPSNERAKDLQLDIRERALYSDGATRTSRAVSEAAAQ